MTATDGPLLAEDLMLLLFDPRSGTIAGEGTLLYALGGAVLADLALHGLVEVDDRPSLLGPKARAVGDVPPTDDLLRDAWLHVRDRSRGVQGLLAGIGPLLREPVLQRLVQAGHVSRERGRILGLVPTTRLVDGGSPRRPELLDAVRAVLVDGADPSPRAGLLAALLSASGNLPTLHRDIPWSGAVHTRGKELERGSWGAAAVGEAVTRTAAALAASSISTAITVNPGR